MKKFTFLVLLLSSFSFAHTNNSAVLAVPTNDICDTAEIVSCGDSISGSTLEATSIGAPSSTCGTDAGAPGVWYAIDGTGDNITVSLCSSSYDTKIQVYEGGCDALTCIGGNDDTCGLQSEMNFNSDTFSTYYIYVYGFGTEIGNFTLDISCIPLISPPTNDLCNDAIPVNCGDSISGSTDEATINNAPLAFCGTGNGAPGIWYVIDGTGDDINVSLCGSSFDTKIQVYEGGCDALTCIGGNDDACGLQSDFSFRSDTFSSYYIYVYGFGTMTGDFTLDITCTPPPPLPTNDDCSSASLIGCGDSVSGTTVGATIVDAPLGICGTGSGAPGVWYEINGTGDVFTLSLCNSNYDTKIQVYEGGCDALTCIAGNDDFCGFQSELQFISDPFSNYLVYVYGFDTEIGNFTLDVTCQPPPPPPVNDECVNAIEIIANPDENCTQFASGTIYGATPSVQSNACAVVADDDVWFKFTAVSEYHVISLNNVVGDTQDLYHVLYEGDDCGNLTQIYCHDDPNSSVASGLTIGSTYMVRVYSWTDTILQNIDFDICVYTIPPPIYTSDDDYTVEELIRNVLVGESTACPQISNITFSTGTNYGSTNGIGYFERNGSAWPYENGLVLTTGDVNKAPGPEDEILFDGSFGWPGDLDLENEIPGLTPGSTYNASIIEFDFVPVIDHMSFDFIFAAEEYGDFQCLYTDAFAFLLTDSNGVTTNLAIIPGTTDPISVLTVRDEAYNAACPSVNAEYFDTYYGASGANPYISPIDFIGHTVSMTAQADVNPNEQYHIKLVVADDGDPFLDSAVFLAGGSFEIGDVDLGQDILLSSSQSTCDGDIITLDAGSIPNNVSLSWYMDGQLINGETSSTIDVYTTGVYTAEKTFTNSACSFSDDILVEFHPNPEVSFSSNNIIKCANEEFILEALVANSSDPNLNTLSYTWYLDGVEVQSSSSSTYQLSATAEEEGLFLVEVEDDITGCIGSSEITVEFYENSHCVDLPQGLSPNGDGYNDCLILDHLEDSDDISKAEVFNRYGTKVYELNDYVDQWCGTDQNEDLLPVGTYFYVIYFKSNKSPITSWIYLNY